MERFAGRQRFRHHHQSSSRIAENPTANQPQKRGPNFTDFSPSKIVRRDEQRMAIEQQSDLIFTEILYCQSNDLDMVFSGRNSCSDGRRDSWYERHQKLTTAMQRLLPVISAS
jgi:hypothetical protein